MALKGLMTRSVPGMTAPVARGEASGGSHGEPTGAEPRARLAQAPGPRTVAPSTSVDAGSELEGRLRCRDTLRIDGRIVGEIECDKTVIVGGGAHVHACIEADEVHVSGIVEGNITARRKVTLDRTAVVVGDLTTPGIVIEEGAKLKGRILIGSDADADAADVAATETDATSQSAKGTAAGKAAAAEVDAASTAGASSESSGANAKKALGPSKQGGDARTKTEQRAPAPA